MPAHKRKNDECKITKFLRETKPQPEDKLSKAQFDYILNKVITQHKKTPTHQFGRCDEGPPAEKALQQAMEEGLESMIEAARREPKNIHKDVESF